MPKKATLLFLPGIGKNILLDLDREMLIKELKAEVEKLVANPLQGRVPPANKASTIMRKKSDIPLRDTGKLLDEIVVETTSSSIKISIQGYYFFLKKPYRLLIRTLDIMRVMDKVAKRYVKRMAKVK